MILRFKRKFRLTFFFLQCSFLSLSAQDTSLPVIEVGSLDFNLDSFEVSMLVDGTRAMTIDKLHSGEFKLKRRESRFTIPSIDNDYWIVFKIHNNSSKSIQRIIGLDEVYLENVDIYYLNDSIWHHEKNGLSVPIYERIIENRCPVFDVPLAAQETKIIYLKLHSEFAVNFGMLIKDYSNFGKSEQVKLIGYWSYFGGAIALVLYNLFILFQIRERVYVYYIIYTSALILFTLLYSGYSLYFNTSVSLHYMLHASLAITGVFTTLFTRSILNIKKIFPTLDKVFLSFAAAYVLLAILIIIDIYYYQWLVIFGMPSMIFLLITACYCFFKKVPLSNFFLLAMTGYLTGLFMIAAVNLGLVPFNTITRYGFLFGSFIELSVFSFALGYRIKLLREEKFTMQNTLLQSQSIMKEKLEIEVKERTADLNQLLETLKKSEHNLQLSNATKDKFFSIISHDLRGPISNTSSILNFMKSGDMEKSDDLISLMSESMNNTSELLADLLMWSRSQNKVLHPNPESIKTHALLDKASKSALISAQNKNISIEIEGNTIDYLVHADLQMTNTILRNLIGNALKFTHTNGHIALSLKEKGDHIEFSITDNGTGISSEVQDQLFNLKMENEPSLGTNNEKGTGLGLVICKELITLNNGAIGVESKLDKGSRFWFTLPKIKKSTASSFE